MSSSTGKTLASDECGMTLLEVIVAVFLLALLAGPLSYLLGFVSKGYGTAAAKQSVIPLAQELRAAVSLGMKSFFTTGKSNPPCRGDGKPLAFADLSIRSGIRLTPLTKEDAAQLPALDDFPLYTQAVKYCQGDSSASLKYAPVDFSPPSAGVPWEIFNPPPNDFGEYRSFDFCATVSCAGNRSNAFDKICQYAGNPKSPFLVVMRYTIRSVTNGTASSCAQVADTWPADALGELSYLFLWSGQRVGVPGGDHFADAGVFFSNKGVVH